MAFMTQEEINVSLFDEVKRLQKEVAELKAERDELEKILNSILCCSEEATECEFGNDVMRDILPHVKQILKAKRKGGE